MQQSNGESFRSDKEQFVRMESVWHKEKLCIKNSGSILESPNQSTFLLTSIHALRDFVELSKW